MARHHQFDVQPGKSSRQADETGMNKCYMDVLSVGGFRGPGTSESKRPQRDGNIAEDETNASQWEHMAKPQEKGCREEDDPIRPL
jgi:hypothetical protein